MSYESLFTLANGLAALCWLPMIVAPGHPLTARLARSPVAPALFALAYGALVVVMLTGPGEGGMDSLAAVRRGFEQDAVLLLGWVHYLCFDLVVGMWEYRDSRRLGLSPLEVAPCLLFTFLLGPVGLLAYLGLRWARRGAVALEPEGGGAGARRLTPEGSPRDALTVPEEAP